MKGIITAFVLVLFSLLFMCSAQAAPGKVEYLEAKPLSKVVTPRLKPVEAGTKLVYDFISGFVQTDDDGSSRVINGRFRLFRNYDEYDNALPRPNTLTDWGWQWVCRPA
jgi:hypothetical protein